MTIDEFLAAIDDQTPPAPRDQLEAFEAEIGSTLPDDYRRFLVRCNGGDAGGACCFVGPKPDGEETFVTIADVFGFRYDDYRSLRHWVLAQRPGGPVPRIAIMSDPGGNLIALGLTGGRRGCVFFVDHEKAVDPETRAEGDEEAGHLDLLAASFTEFVAGIRPTDEVA